MSRPRERMSATPNTAAGLLRMLLTVDVRELLDDVRAPVLVLHRAGLVVLVHPETGHARADHTAHALWLGAVLPLELSVLPE